MPNNSALLPLGSVVTLKGATKKIMVAGRLQKRTGESTIYDYCAVLWPEGLIDSTMLYVFNHDDIDKIWFTGGVDEDEEAFAIYLENERQGKH